MIDKVIGAVILCVCIGGMVYMAVDMSRTYCAMLRDERLARIEANERCYKTQTWMCYMDEKIRADKEASRADEAERKLARAKDIMAKAKLKYEE